VTLLSARHRNPESAALSIAANRASKCELLRSEREDSDPEHAARLTGYADRNAASLEADVADWLKRTAAGKRASEQTRELLNQIVRRAYAVPDELEAYARQYGPDEAVARAREAGGFGV
jgi:hypothetical protein